VPKEELNLFQFAARGMTQPGTCPSEIVRRQPLNARFTGVLPDDVPGCLFRQTVTPCLPYTPKQPVGVQVRGLKPFIEYCLDPPRHRYCPGVAGFAFQVDTGPVVFPLLDVAEIQIDRLVPSKAAGERDYQESAIPLTLQSASVGRVPEPLRLFRRQDVASLSTAATRAMAIRIRRA
jgi:hypothetical protein